MQNITNTLTVFCAPGEGNIKRCSTDLLKMMGNQRERGKCDLAADVPDIQEYRELEAVSKMHKKRALSRFTIGTFLSLSITSDNVFLTSMVKKLCWLFFPDGVLVSEIEEDHAKGFFFHRGFNIFDRCNIVFMRQ